MGKAKSEYEVEDLLLERLQQIGYSYIELNNYDELEKNFRKQLCVLNGESLIEKKGIAELSDSEFHRVMLRLENKTIYESAKILRDKWVLDLDNGKSMYLKFFTNDVSKNIFQVTHQVRMTKKDDIQVKKNNRFDVTVLINGLPLVQIELKRPGIEINEAINQINRYRKDSFKGLFRYIQIFIVSNSVQTKYMANANETDKDGKRIDLLKSLAFYWTDDKNVRINKLIPFAEDFLDKFSITEMIDKYMVVKESEPVIMAMRPYQIYAVKKAVERVVTSNMSGFVFHTTGSGKTLTSFKLATILRNNAAMSKVIFLVDRKDLDDQTVDEYNSFEEGCVDNTPNTKNLVADLQDSNKKMIITTIQKMARALTNEKYEAVMEEYKNKKVAFIIDECHRSQFGKMHGMIRKHFQNADYIGFTGTPIFKENCGPNGQTTADLFKAGTLPSCIHQYMIKEAIADGNVLRFSVEFMRNQNMSVVFEGLNFDQKRVDDPEYWQENGLNINEYYHKDERLEEIAVNILDNLYKNTRLTADTYTAMFATDRVDTMLRYYDFMKKHNTKGFKIAAICNCQQNEDMEAGCDETTRDRFDKCIEDYNKMFGTSFDSSTFDAYRKDVIKRMKQRTMPQIDLLLVVDMMLTGFDSKPTNLLILDKNLEWHGLLQAYSRTNRVDKVTKQFGKIITYRNIKKAQDEALKLFSGEGDPDGFLMKSYEYYLALFGEEVQDLKNLYPDPDAVGHLQDETKKVKFVLLFRPIIGTYAVLKTFSKFEQADCDVFMDEDQFFEYKSWYLTFYDEMKQEKENGGKGKKGEGNEPGNGDDPVLIDIDFNIELVRTDKINVVYILNLLKEINRKDKAKMEEAIDLIMREIERSDNEKLRYKKDIMKAFISQRFFELDPEEDIIKAYEQYEKELLDENIVKFAADNEVSKDTVNNLLTKYFANEKSVTEEDVRLAFADMDMGLLQLTALIDDVISFIKDMYNKFTAEGD